MSKLFLGAAAACALGLSPAIAEPAGAAVVLITYTGTVRGDDAGNYFGGGALDGQEFTLRYALDTETPGAYYYQSPTWSYITGSNAASNPLRTELTINSTTYSWGDSIYSSGGTASQFDEHDANSDGVSHYSQDVVFDGSFLDSSRADAQIFSSHNEIVATSDLTASLDYTVHGGFDSAYGFIQFYRSHADGSGFERYSDARLDIARVTIVPQSPGAIPEPSTWAMMIVGFGAVGWAMRRRPGRRWQAACAADVGR